MTKTVNLDDAKNTVEVTIAGMTFVISRVVLAVHDMYNQYIEELSACHEKQSEKSPMQLMRDFVDIRKRWVEPIMMLLLEKNGYEYDAQWWKENVESYETMDNFIRTCLTKDVEDKKKVEPEAVS